MSASDQLHDDILIARIPGHSEVAIDSQAIADVLLEGLAESARARGAVLGSAWGDVAEAAELLIHYVTSIAAEDQHQGGGGMEQTSNEGMEQTSNEGMEQTSNEI
jgi:hypothetical protein